MKADCHIHMLLDGAYWKDAIARHQHRPDIPYIRGVLSQYQKAGFTYLRDGGDRWDVGKTARTLAPEYGITYKTPLAPLCRQGHYGGFIGIGYENLKEYAKLVKNHQKNGADFIKIMISGLMDFSRFGRLTEPGQDPAEIRQIIHIAHEEGFAVMAHANGAETVTVAAEAGVDSVEHGAYLDEAALLAMKEAGTVWVPTLATVSRLPGKGRFPEEAVRRILDSFRENVEKFHAMGGLLAPGSDAGAWQVFHPETQDELPNHNGLAVIMGKF